MYKTTCSNGQCAVYLLAYNTGEDLLSPVLNFDGTQVAYIQDSGAGTQCEPGSADEGKFGQQTVTAQPW